MVVDSALFMFSRVMSSYLATIMVVVNCIFKVDTFFSLLDSFQFGVRAHCALPKLKTLTMRESVVAVAISL